MTRLTVWSTGSSPRGPGTPHHPVNTVQGGPGDGHRDGTIDGIGFTAVYRRGHGRDMETFAC
jgi:hypothetical protein